MIFKMNVSVMNKKKQEREGFPEENKHEAKSEEPPKISMQTRKTKKTFPVKLVKTSVMKVIRQNLPGSSVLK